MFRRIWEQLAIATNWPVLAAVLVLSSVGIGTYLGLVAEGVEQITVVETSADRRVAVRAVGADDAPFAELHH